jgi:hypothetical protein
VCNNSVKRLQMHVTVSSRQPTRYGEAIDAAARERQRRVLRRLRLRVWQRIAVGADRDADSLGNVRRENVRGRFNVGDAVLRGYV